jgi:outer membrane murein-binding lipoprotein Lpp
MGIPKQVQKQSEEVQALYKELNGETENVQAANAEAPEVPAEQPVEQPSNSVDDKAPESEVKEQNQTDTQPKETWEQKYKTLQGMYNADVPRLNATNRELNSRVSQLETLLSTMQQPQATTPEPESVDPLITDADMKEYGDSIDVMRRAAREEVNTANGRIAQLEKTIQQLQGVVPQVHQVQAQQKASSEQAF